MSRLYHESLVARRRFPLEENRDKQNDMDGRKLGSHALAAACLVLLVPGCGGPQTKDETPAVTVASAAASASPPPPAESDAKPESKPAQEKPNRCLAAGPFPILPEAPKPIELLPCRPADKKAEKAVTDFIRNNYTPKHPGGKLEVKYDCDGLDKTITKIVYEAGGGHGSMTLVRIERADPAAPTYEVTGILKPGGIIRANPPHQYGLFKGQVSVDAVTAKMPLVRAALRAKNLTEVGGDQNKGMGFGSSSSTYLLVRIEDAAGRVMESQYAGPVSSTDQDKRVPLEAAMENVQAIVATPQWQYNTPVPDDMRQFFEQRFLADMSHFNDEWAWWVRERFVELAAHAGTKTLVPSLLHLLKDPSKTGASGGRTRDYAVEALVALTSWDPRAPTPGTGEKPHSNEEAAKEFLDQCGKVPMAPPNP